MTGNVATAAFSHVIADFVGVQSHYLTDGALMSSLLIAAAGAAGFSTMGPPIVRRLPGDGVAAVLILDGCHMAVHTFPDRELMLLDVLALATHDARKALDVFNRRLHPRELRSESRLRG